MSLVQRLLLPVVEVRKEESATALLMFAYSFLAMTAYNIIQPLTRSKLIDRLGAVNVPWVVLASGLVMGVIMLAYTRAVSALPKRWALSAALGVMAVVMLAFWGLFQTGRSWVPILFYVWGNLLGILVISQFWTLANGVYDPRQAKRLFGFIGGGVALGGMTGAALTALLVEKAGANRLLLASAVALLLASVIVAVILGREHKTDIVVAADEERGVSTRRAIELLRSSRQIQLIAVVIAFGALGAALFDQQLNMATEIFKGGGTQDSMGAFLAKVRFWVSAAVFVLQVWVTPRVHRYLGVGFALMMLPTNLAIMGALIIVRNVLWAPAIASITDRSVRYSVDKTTREVLFLPLPKELRQEIKPFVDVTVDRLSKGFASLLMLVLIQPWGLRLQWYQLSYVGLGLAAVWYVMAFRAKREYMTSFRRSLETRQVETQEQRLNVADLSTIETLIEELAHPDPARVVYAIDVLESLDKRNLVTPLLLYHDSSVVRRRALGAIGAVRGEIAERWAPQIRRLLSDPDAGVRAAAIGALGAISNDDVATLARPMLTDADRRIRVTAAVALASSAVPADVDAAESTLLTIASDTGEEGRKARRDVAAAIRQIPHSRFLRMLIPLLYDPAPEVADEAMESVRTAGVGDFVFVPTLVALLRHRQLKGQARRVLVSYGEPVIPALEHFMRDPDEDIWVRRHTPATLAQIPSQKSVDALLGALEERDGFLRFKVVAALERLRRERPDLVFARELIESLAVRESGRYFNALSLHANLFERGRMSPDSLLAHALVEKIDRTKDRIYRLISLIYPWKDIAAARWTLEHGDPRSRASASEYLDNVLGGQLRKRVMPILEDLPADEKVRRGNVLLKTRPRDVEETLLQLINDDDQVVAAAAIDLVRQEKLWALGGDIEHVLAHRDVRDWYVFEAASWALAEQRMSPERRHALWLEPLPAAELAGRLRQLPLFASVSVDELFRIAAAARQTRHEPGSVLLPEGVVPDVIHLLLDGRVTAASREGAARTIEATAALGFDEAMQGQPMRETARTLDIAVTLALTKEELRTLLSDNTALVAGLFATIVQRAGADDRAVRPTGAAAELGAIARTGLTPVEKVLALRQVPLFARLSPEEMANLSFVAHAVTMTKGQPLFEESSAQALWLLLNGAVVLESSAGTPPLTATAGDVIGAAHAMAGRPLGRTAQTTEDGLALRIDRDDLFELLSDRPEMLRQMFAALFRGAERERVVTA